MLVVVIGHEGEGPGIDLVRELERTCASRCACRRCPTKPSRDLARDGIEPDTVDAVVALADGLPGLARREAAAWAERAAAERLSAAAAASVGAESAAAAAGASVLDEVTAARRVPLASGCSCRSRPCRASAVPVARDLRGRRRRPVRGPRASRRRAHRADDRPPSRRRGRSVRQWQVVDRSRRPATARAQRTAARRCRMAGRGDRPRRRRARRDRRCNGEGRRRPAPPRDRSVRGGARHGAGRCGGRPSARPPARPGGGLARRRGDPCRSARRIGVVASHVRDDRGRPNARRPAVDRGDSSDRARAGAPDGVRGGAGTGVDGRSAMSPATMLHSRWCPLRWPKYGNGARTTPFPPRRTQRSADWLRPSSVSATARSTRSARRVVVRCAR